MRYTEKDRDIQKKRDTYTVKEIEIGAETKIRTKRHERERERERKERQRRREVITHTHGRKRDLQTHKKKAPQGCKERGREVQDRREDRR